MGSGLLSIKTADDFAKMAVAGRVVAELHAEVRAAAKPGVSLKALDEIAEKVVRAHDCRPSFLGYQGTYPATICASPNSVIVHGIPTDYRLRDGDILSIDAGAIYQGWHGDAAFTMGIGEISAEAQQLIDVTEQGLWNGLAEAKAGNRVGDIGAAVEATAAPYGFGVVQGYTGHGIGQAMHEAPSVPNYGRRRRGFKLREGMALAIEPMFNLGTPDTAVLDDNWTVVTADGAWSAHWEHTVGLTPDGSFVFTLPEPKQVA
ncbi:methionine aminopeptidase 1 [bacterium BMS3Bbin02]|nr:methionine aminopeptidase 1 [bacterium BMS3Bbin02]